MSGRLRAGLRVYIYITRIQMHVHEQRVGVEGRFLPRGIYPLIIDIRITSAGFDCERAAHTDGSIGLPRMYIYTSYTDTDSASGHPRR